MLLVSGTQVDDTQHGKNKGLQCDNQDVENRPRHVKQPDRPERQQRNKNEDHFTGKHVAEQTHGQAEGLDQQANHFQEQVERNQRPVIEGVERQLQGKATNAFHLEAVVNNQAKYTQRHAQGGIGIGSRYDFHVLDTEAGKDFGTVINRYDLEAIHEENPHEQCQRQGCNVGVLAVKRRTHQAFDEFNDDLDDILQTSGNASSRHLAGLAK